MQCNIVQPSGTLYMIEGNASSESFVQFFLCAAVLCDSVSNRRAHSLMQWVIAAGEHS